MTAGIPAAELLSSRAFAAISVLDLTSLRPDDTPETIARLCRRAAAPAPGSPSAAAVCVLPRLVAAARKELRGTGVRIASVAGDFPSGRAPLAEKIEEVRRAVAEGADEIDAPIDREAFGDGAERRVADEIAAIRQACPGSTLKVILETGELGPEERVRRAAFIAIAAGADFVKSSTGTIPAGAALDTIRMLLEEARDAEHRLGRRVGVKASGGIRRHADAFAYLDLAERIRGPEGALPGRFRIGASSLLEDLVAASHGAGR
jgi:deoxyribose-phosphate aldolase